MKIRLYQLKILPGQPTANLTRMLQAINEAKKEAIDIIVFPEMAIPGYLLGDEWERLAFIKECEACGEQIKKHSSNICIIFGNVAIDWTAKNEDGRVRKYNALFAAENGKFISHPTTQHSFFIKVLMPNYRQFDDNRHFYDPRKLAFELGQSIETLIQPVVTRLGNLACIICEDGWDQDYNVSPLSVLSKKNIQVYINISCSPYTFNKDSKRNSVFSEQAKKLKAPLLYINNIGIQDNAKTLFTFDGSSRAYNSSGEIIGKIAAFTEGSLDVNLNNLPAADRLNTHNIDNISHQFRAIQYGIREFMRRIGLNKIVIGVSGGIDSAVVAGIFRSILEPDNILLVSMPGPFTSKTTLNLAKDLANNLGCFFSEIPIEPSVEITRKQLQEVRFKRKEYTKTLPLSDFVFENIQARDRSARILAAVASAFEGAFTCNANKSEMTVGYSTLYGDLGGFLAPIADLWKGEVYEMATYINNHIYHKAVIPLGTINIVPSAELSASHNVDAGQGDPLHYPYHDALFKSWVEYWNRATPEDNLQWYLEGCLGEKINYDGDINQLLPTQQAFINDLERWWKLYQGMAIAKRIQAPPIIAVKRRAFGFDHRESQLGPRFSQLYIEMKEKIQDEI